MKRLTMIAAMFLLGGCAAISNPATKTVLACHDLDEVSLIYYAVTRIVKRGTDDPNPKNPPSKTKETIDKAITALDDDSHAILDAKLDDE